MDRHRLTPILQMHRLFCIAEVVDNIVDAVVSKRLDEDEDDDDVDVDDPHQFTGIWDERAFKEVKALALTSKTFREATLNAMWSTQKSLLPLFRSIGIISDHSEVEGRRSWTYARVLVPSFTAVAELCLHGHAQTCLRVLEPQDCPNLIQYSSRIKTLDLHTPHTIKWSGMVPSAISRLSIDCSLPSVESISVKRMSHSSSSFSGA